MHLASAILAVQKLTYRKAARGLTPSPARKGWGRKMGKPSHGGLKSSPLPCVLFAWETPPPKPAEWGGAGGEAMRRLPRQVTSLVSGNRRYLTLDKPSGPRAIQLN